MNQSLISNGGSGGATEMSRSIDAGKINQLFEKISSADNLEIEERSVKNLAQKLKLKLMEPIYLSVYHAV